MGKDLSGVAGGDMQARGAVAGRAVACEGGGYGIGGLARATCEGVLVFASVCRGRWAWHGRCYLVCRGELLYVHEKPRNGAVMGGLAEAMQG